MPDIAATIWRKAVPGPYPDTAEERAAVDAVLKAGIYDIPDGPVRQHALYLIRCTRAAAMRGEILPERWLNEA